MTGLGVGVPTTLGAPSVLPPPLVGRDVLPLPPPSWWLGLCVSMDLSLQVSLNTKTKIVIDTEVNDEVDRSYNVVLSHVQYMTKILVGLS